MSDVASQTYIEVLAPQEEIKFEYRDCIIHHNVIDGHTIMISMGGESTGVAYFTSELQLCTEMFQIGKNLFRSGQRHVAIREKERLLGFLQDMIFNPNVRARGETQRIFLSGNLTHVLIPDGFMDVKIDLEAYDNPRKNPDYFINEIIKPILHSLRTIEGVNGSTFHYILFDARWDRSMTNDLEHVIIVDVGSSASKVNGIIVCPSFTSMIDETRMWEQFGDTLRQGQTLENWQLNKIFNYLRQYMSTHFNGVRFIGTEGIRNFVDTNNLPLDQGKVSLDTLLSFDAHPLHTEYQTMMENVFPPLPPPLYDDDGDADTVTTRDSESGAHPFHTEYQNNVLLPDHDDDDSINELAERLDITTIDGDTDTVTTRD